MSSRVYPDLERVPGKQNWVEKTGGLPSYIERIAKHLHYEKGRTIGAAIATAVETTRRWCSTGKNWNGGDLKPATRAKACKAAASWEAKKAKSKAKTAAKKLKESAEMAEARELVEAKGALPCDDMVAKEIAGLVGKRLVVAEGMLPLLKEPRTVGKHGLVRAAVELLEAELSDEVKIGMVGGPAADPRDMKIVADLLEQEVEELRALAESFGSQTSDDKPWEKKNPKGKKGKGKKLSPAAKKKAKARAKKAGRKYPNLIDNMAAANEMSEGGGMWLRRGSKGEAVKEVQEQVESMGRWIGDAGADGKFGYNTEKGVKAVQRREGLKADGVVGPKTKAMLDEKAKKPEMVEAKGGVHPYDPNRGNKVVGGRTEAAAFSKSDAQWGLNDRLKRRDGKGVADPDFEKKHPRGRDGRWIQKGASGAEVRGIQRDLGMNNASGQFDERTEQAVRRFQEQNDLQVDGVVGRQTAAAMMDSQAPVGQITDEQRKFLAGRAKRPAGRPLNMRQAVEVPEWSDTGVRGSGGKVLQEATDKGAIAQWLDAVAKAAMNGDAEGLASMFKSKTWPESWDADIDEMLYEGEDNKLEIMREVIDAIRKRGDQPRDADFFRSVLADEMDDEDDGPEDMEEADIDGSGAAEAATDGNVVSAPEGPPNLRESRGGDMRCETCEYFENGKCVAHGGHSVKGNQVCDAWEAATDMAEAKLTAQQRKRLPESSFALPGRRYPIHTENHARSALARVEQHGNPEEKAKVKAAVKRRYPDMELQEASLRGAASSGLRSLRSIDVGLPDLDRRKAPRPIYRLPDGTFAPKGMGAILRPGDDVVLPDGKRGQVSQDGKSISVPGAGTQRVAPEARGADSPSLNQQIEREARIATGRGMRGMNSPETDREIEKDAKRAVGRGMRSPDLSDQNENLQRGITGLIDDVESIYGPRETLSEPTQQLFNTLESFSWLSPDPARDVVGAFADVMSEWGATGDDDFQYAKDTVRQFGDIEDRWDDLLNDMLGMDSPGYSWQMGVEDAENEQWTERLRRARQPELSTNDRINLSDGIEEVIGDTEELFGKRPTMSEPTEMLLDFLDQVVDNEARGPDPMGEVRKLVDELRRDYFIDDEGEIMPEDFEYLAGRLTNDLGMDSPELDAEIERDAKIAMGRRARGADSPETEGTAADLKRGDRLPEGEVTFVMNTMTADRRTGTMKEEIEVRLDNGESLTFDMDAPVTFQRPGMDSPEDDLLSDPDFYKGPNGIPFDPDKPDRPSERLNDLRDYQAAVAEMDEDGLAGVIAGGGPRAVVARAEMNRRGMDSPELDAQIEKDAKIAMGRRARGADSPELDAEIERDAKIAMGRRARGADSPGIADPDGLRMGIREIAKAEREIGLLRMEAGETVTDSTGTTWQKVAKPKSERRSGNTWIAIDGPDRTEREGGTDTVQGATSRELAARMSGGMDSPDVTSEDIERDARIALGQRIRGMDSPDISMGDAMEALAMSVGRDGKIRANGKVFTKSPYISGGQAVRLVWRSDDGDILSDARMGELLVSDEDSRILDIGAPPPGMDSPADSLPDEEVALAARIIDGVSNVNSFINEQDADAWDALRDEKGEDYIDALRDAAYARSEWWGMDSPEALDTTLGSEVVIDGKTFTKRLTGLDVPNLPSSGWTDDDGTWLTNDEVRERLSSEASATASAMGMLSPEGEVRSWRAPDGSTIMWRPDADGDQWARETGGEATALPEAEAIALLSPGQQQQLSDYRIARAGNRAEMTGMRPATLRNNRGAAAPAMASPGLMDTDAYDPYYEVFHMRKQVGALRYERELMEQMLEDGERLGKPHRVAQAKREIAMLDKAIPAYEQRVRAAEGQIDSLRPQAAARPSIVSRLREAVGMDSVALDEDIDILEQDLDRPLVGPERSRLMTRLRMLHAAIYSPVSPDDSASEIVNRSMRDEALRREYRVIRERLNQDALLRTDDLGMDSPDMRSEIADALGIPPEEVDLPAGMGGPEAAPDAAELRSMNIAAIASLIVSDWGSRKGVSPEAQPYLDAMSALDTLDSPYGVETGRQIVPYFLANASRWTGPVARAVKKELKSRLETERGMESPAVMDAIDSAIGAVNRWRESLPDLDAAFEEITGMGVPAEIAIIGERDLRGSISTVGSVGDSLSPSIGDNAPSLQPRQATAPRPADSVLNLIPEGGAFKAIQHTGEGTAHPGLPDGDIVIYDAMIPYGSGRVPVRNWMFIPRGGGAEDAVIAQDPETLIAELGLEPDEVAEIVIRKGFRSPEGMGSPGDDADIYEGQRAPYRSLHGGVLEMASGADKDYIRSALMRAVEDESVDVNDALGLLEDMDRIGLSLRVTAARDDQREMLSEAIKGYGAPGWRRANLLESLDRRGMPRGMNSPDDEYADHTRLRLLKAEDGYYLQAFKEEDRVNVTPEDTVAGPFATAADAKDAALNDFDPNEYVLEVPDFSGTILGFMSPGESDVPLGDTVEIDGVVWTKKLAYDPPPNLPAYYWLSDTGEIRMGGDLPGESGQDSPDDDMALIRSLATETRQDSVARFERNYEPNKDPVGWHLERWVRQGEMERRGVLKSGSLLADPDFYGEDGIYPEPQIEFPGDSFDSPTRKESLIQRQADLAVFADELVKMSDEELDVMARAGGPRAKAAFSELARRSTPVRPWEDGERVTGSRVREPVAMASPEDDLENYQGLRDQEREIMGQMRGLRRMNYADDATRRRALQELSDLQDELDDLQQRLDAVERSEGMASPGVTDAEREAYAGVGEPSDLEVESMTDNDLRAMTAAGSELGQAELDRRAANMMRMDDNALNKVVSDDSPMADSARAELARREAKRAAKDPADMNRKQLLDALGLTPAQADGLSMDELRSRLEAKRS